MRILFTALLLLAASGCSDEDCAELTLEECADSGECSVAYASKIADGCVTKSVAAGCMARGLICGSALMVAKDAQGDKWLFPSVCIPGNFTETSDNTNIPQCE